MGYHTKFFQITVKKYKNDERFFSPIYYEKEKIRQLLLSIPKDKKIIGTTRKTSMLYTPGMTNIYIVESGLQRNKTYDYLFYWKDEKYLFEGSSVNKKVVMDKHCSSSVSSTILDSEVFYLAKGRFERDCYEFNYP